MNKLLKWFLNWLTYWIGLLDSIIGIITFGNIYLNLTMGYLAWKTIYILDRKDTINK